VNVLFVASEVAPFAKTGGLGDVGGALPRALAASSDSHDIRIVMPLYGHTKGVDRTRIERVIRDVTLDMGSTRISFSVFASTLPGTRVPVYFVHCPKLYGRTAIYTQDHDEHLRFAVLNWAALVVCQRLGFSPDVVHANDWQTSLIPLLLKSMFAWDRLFERTRSLLTIHNLGHQGVFGAEVLGELGLGPAAHHLHQEQLRSGRINFLLTGILYANALSTVSPTYAREVQEPDHGVGLDAFLRERSEVLFGVLNGIDESEWNPASDPLIPFTYSEDDFSGKERNKKALLEALGLTYVQSTPTIAIVSRLAWQKGFELCFSVLPKLLSQHAVNLVVLGTGETKYQDFFRSLARQFPRQAAYVGKFSERAAHLFEAGADMFLMPSRYEPCGLNQMYSLRYGTVPIVHRTGGLADTVHGVDTSAERGNGFVFDHFTEAGLAWALSSALRTWGSGMGADRERWQSIQRRGMQMRFGWSERVSAYERIYQWIAPGR